MKKLTMLTNLETLAMTIAIAMTLAMAAATYAAPDKAVFTSALVWRGDTSGDYSFKDAGVLDMASAAKDGSIETSSSSGTYAVTSSITTAGNITSINASWSFTGKVTLEVSATGNLEDYVGIVNGVPLTASGFKTGRALIWRATLGPDSSLREVRISYADDAGTKGDFGNPELTGFEKRIPIVIARSEATKQSQNEPQTSLFNYQVAVNMKLNNPALNFPLRISPVHNYPCYLGLLVLFFYFFSLSFYKKCG